MSVGLVSAGVYCSFVVTVEGGLLIGLFGVYSSWWAFINTVSVVSLPHEDRDLSRSLPRPQCPAPSRVPRGGLLSD